MLVVAFDKAGYAVMIFHLRIIHLRAYLSVYQRSDHDYAAENIEPEHQNYYGSKGTVNKRISYGKAYEPGKNKADSGKQQRAENRSRKGDGFIWAVPF